MIQVATTDDIKRLGTILSVWAHPDDETVSCAGIMAAAVRNGQQIACLTATKGEAGVQNHSKWPAEKLGEIRANEMTEALAYIGCQNHHWLGYKDGACHEVSDEVGAQHVRHFVEKYKPDTILTFGPEGLTGHTDHQAVSRWAKMAAGSQAEVYYAVEEKRIYDNYLIHADKKFNFYFNIDRPPVYPANDCQIALELTPELIEIKKSALKAMESQYEAFFEHMSEEFVQAMISVECFVKAS
jgi:LmbE family N-acetylglucosaminyl deacetylase